MGALAEVLEHPARRSLVPVRDPKEVVAVVLSDGTVRDLRDGCGDEKRSRYAVGSITGPDWILWWDRRSF